MTFTGDDLLGLAGLVADSWRAGRDRDWTAPAGTLDWSCAHTADHTVDTVLAPAFFLVSRRQDDYPPYGVFTAGADAGPEVRAEALEAAARILAGVVASTDADVRAVIWRRPRIECRGPDDFVPRGALELILHAHDISTGIDVAFTPPPELCQRLRAHTQAWPHWSSPGWSALTMEGDPWTDLLVASGRPAPATS